MNTLFGWSAIHHRTIIRYLFVSVYLTSVHTESCFTADVSERELHLSCSVEAVSFPVIIQDPLGHTVISCENNTTAPVCTHSQQHGKILSTNLHDRTLLLAFRHKQGIGIDGKWVCKNGEHVQEINISYSEGSIGWTKVDIRGEIVSTKGKRISISCSTCQNPNENIVEYLINDTTIDFVRFVPQSGCYHKEGICSPNKCRCAVGGRIYTRLFGVIANSSGDTTYTCAMHFDDKLQKKHFTVFSSLLLTNNSFQYVDPKKIVTKPGISFSGVQYTTPTASTINTTNPQSEEITPEVVAVISVVAVVMIICGIICRQSYRYREQKQKRKNRKETEMKELAEDYDSKNPFLKKVRKEVDDDQENTPIIQEENEVENLIKLNRLISRIGMKVARAYFTRQVLLKSTLSSFLVQKKHKLFHALHPKRRCCQCLKKRKENDQGVLLKGQFLNLFEYSEDIMSCNCSYKTQCICKFAPNKAASVDTLDLSTIIGILSILPIYNTTINNFYKLRNFCNTVIQFRSTGKVPNEQFEKHSKEFKSFFICLALDAAYKSREAIEKDICQLYTEKIKETTDEFKEIFLQSQYDFELSSRVQQELRFTKAAKKFDSHSTVNTSVRKLNHLRVYVPDVEDVIVQKYMFKEKPMQEEALIKIRIPQTWDKDAILACIAQTWDLDVILPCSSDRKTKTRLKIIGKSTEDLFFVIIIPVDLLDDKPLLEDELFLVVEGIVRISNANTKLSAEIQIDIAFTNVIKEQIKPTPNDMEKEILFRMYLRRGTVRPINSFAVLSEDEVAFTVDDNDEHNAFVMFNFKTQVRHSYNLPGKPFDMAVLSDNQIALSFPDLMAIYLYSIRNKMSIPSDIYKINEKCFSIGKRDESSIYVFIWNKGLHVLNLLSRCLTVLETKPFNFNPYSDAMTFGDRRIHYICSKEKSIYRYDIKTKQTWRLPTTISNPSSIATFKNRVLVSASDNSRKVYVKRVDVKTDQCILSRTDGLEHPNIIHYYEKKSWLVFVNKKSGFASIVQLRETH